MQKKILPAYMLTFVNVLGFSILMPVLPFVVEDFGAPEWVYGLLLTSYSAFQFIGAPLLGAVSDERGRKPILLISQAGTLLSWFVFLLALTIPDIRFAGIALSLIIIAISRVLDGITGGNVAVANAYVADITTPKEKSYIFGNLGGVAGIGLIVGPGLGGITASTSLGHIGTLITAIIISTLTLLALFFFLKESLPKERRRPIEKHSLRDSFFILRRIRKVNPVRFIKTLFVIKFFFSAMLAFYMSTIALFIKDLFLFEEKELGFFMIAVGIFLFVNQAILSRWFIAKFGGFNTLLIGLILSAFGLIAITLTDVLWLYITFYYVMNLGLSLCFPTFNSLIAKHANPERQGEVMGISESINSLALAVFPVLAAGIYGLIGYHVYYFIALLPIIGFLVAIYRGKGEIRRSFSEQ